MKRIKGTALSLALGLGLTLSAVSFAQNSTPKEQEKKPECCAMASCCCKGDGQAQKDKSCCQKHSADQKGCCGGDSCNIKMKHKDKQKDG